MYRHLPVYRERMMPSLYFDAVLLPGGWARSVRMTVDDGVIVYVAADVPPERGDTRAGTALPGVPNLHSHAFQRAMAGLTEAAGPGGDSFWTWREAMYRFVDRLTPDDLHAIAAMAQVEMLESGFTRVGEFHYLHHAADGSPYAKPAAMAEAIAAACEETGIALTLLPVFYAHAGFGGVPASSGQRRFLSSPDSYAALHEDSRRAVASLPDATVGIAPHSLRAVTPEELIAVTALTNGPVHIHAAEQVREVEECVAWSGARPIAWLLDNTAVDERWCVVHATHMTPAETEALARSGAVVGLCPITEANLGDGIFPAHDYLAAGGRFGIGSDSNVRVDAPEELRLLEYGQRLQRRERNVLTAGGATGAALYAGAVRGGAQALGVPAGLAIGAPADFVTLDLDHPSLGGRSGDALIDSLVFAAGSAAIASVWRRGSQVVSAGHHLRRDAIVERYRATLARLLA
jgi:formiminoglutamate deiminase